MYYIWLTMLLLPIFYLSMYWLCFCSLGFLDAPAFEDGILERYPIFLNIVLNHVSDDRSDLSCAVSCLKASFEMLGKCNYYEFLLSYEAMMNFSCCKLTHFLFLGCKLWLRTTLSPNVMRNTLLGHCFHTRDEKSHKEIFDLFLPFLQACLLFLWIQWYLHIPIISALWCAQSCMQSLEALQDGDHEKQRRNILYFLLHQVTRSSNFSALMRKTATKVSFFCC